MNSIDIPYGKSSIKYFYNQDHTLDVIAPIENKISKKQEIESVSHAIQAFSRNLDNSLLLTAEKTVAIAVNDLTRPIPHSILLPRLLEYLKGSSIVKDNISFFVATGTHRKLSDHELSILLSPGIVKEYRTHVHDCDDRDQLTYLGKSSIGTPIFINSQYYAHDIKIVVGHIEPHHFMGFSGGVKSAVIGLGGRRTIEANHRLISDHDAKMGYFYSNPMRKDIEEIGKTIGIDLALNVVLNSNHQIVDTFFGDPYQVMIEGIITSKHACQVSSDKRYDLIIASPGGYPKDINLYQSQKAITHACAFLKPYGVVVLVAECIDGPGSKLFEEYFDNKENYQEVIDTFENENFRIGPHKAYQLALQIKDHSIYLLSSLDPEIVKKMFITPINTIEQAIFLSKDRIPAHPDVAAFLFATHNIPII